LQSRCAALIAEAEQELLDSKGLLQALRESPPARAGVIDRFFDPELQVEQSLSFRPTSGEGQDGSHTVIDLLQAQSLRLANVEVELEKAKRALNERKIVERAKGILMARYDLSEDEAYKKMRTASMDKNIRLVEVAESILPLS
ncbi:MAG: ANTAR domain-containing protein, partial [Candidatus Thiodiazotropha sp.]